MKTNFQLTAAVAATALLAVPSQAAVVASWDFTGESLGTNTGFASDVNPGIVLNNTGLGTTGVTGSMFATVDQSTPGYTHDGRGFHMTHDALRAASTPVSTDEYLGFQVTVAEASNFTSFSFDFGADNISNSNGSRVRLSLFAQVNGGGFAEIDGPYVEMKTTANSTANRYNIGSFTKDLSGLGSFSGGEVVDFRIAFSDSGSNKTDRYAFVDNLVLENNLPVPEPGSLALLGLGGLCVLKRRRRDV